MQVWAQCFCRFCHLSRLFCSSGLRVVSRGIEGRRTVRSFPSCAGQTVLRSLLLPRIFLRQCRLDLSRRHLLHLALSLSYPSLLLVDRLFFETSSFALFGMLVQVFFSQEA